MNWSTLTWTAEPVRWRARSVSSFWVTTTSHSSLRLEIALLVTSMSSKPAARTFLRSTVAPMAEDPMPASQAKAIRLIGPEWPEASAAAAVPAPVAAAPVRAPATEDFLPFISSIRAVAAPRSPSCCLPILRIRADSTKLTAAAASTARAMPR